MPSSESGEVTRLLRAWCGGDSEALEQLAPLVEFELRRLARRYLVRESRALTLQPTALINEAYLRLVQWDSIQWQDRAHFYAVASKMMRRVLVNHAVALHRQKRGGGTAVLVSLTEADARPYRTANIIALDEALTALAKLDDRKHQLVELRFFGGLNASEIGEILGISERTVHREWDLARAWLFRELSTPR